MGIEIRKYATRPHWTYLATGRPKSPEEPSRKGLRLLDVDMGKLKLGILGEGRPDTEARCLSADSAPIWDRGGEMATSQINSPGATRVDAGWCG